MWQMIRNHLRSWALVSGVMSIFLLIFLVGRWTAPSPERVVSTTTPAPVVQPAVRTVVPTAPTPAPAYNGEVQKVKVFCVASKGVPQQSGDWVKAQFNAGRFCDEEVVSITTSSVRGEMITQEIRVVGGVGEISLPAGFRASSVTAKPPKGMVVKRSFNPSSGTKVLAVTSG